MPHRKVIIVFVAVFFIAAILRGLERPGTAIVDHPVTAVLRPFRLTPLITPALLLYTTRRASPAIVRGPAIHTIPGRSTISCLFCLPRPPS
jgi:hypothetical protein